MSTIATAGELDLTHPRPLLSSETTDISDLADRIDYPRADDDYYCLAY